MQDAEWTRRPLLSTFDGNNRQMLEGICDSLSHVRTVFVPQSNDSIQAPGTVYANSPNANQMHIPPPDTPFNANPAAQKNSPVSVGLPEKVTSKMTRQNRGQYNERAMRKIRDDLTLFAHEPSGPNSSFVNGIDMDSCVANKHLLQQLAARGYDESVASRALNLSGNKSVEAALEILQGLPLVENKNGINKTSYLYKLIRKPSFDEKYRQTQSSPVSVSDSNSVRSDSPGIGPSVKPIFTQEPPHIIATQAINMVSSKNKGQITPNLMVNGHYTPPPLPPRVPIGMPMLQVMARGQTPPPPISGQLIAADQIPHSLSSQSLLKQPPPQTSTQHQQHHGAPPEHVQQLLKRMSPMQTDNMRAHGIVFSTPTFSHQQPQQQPSALSSGGVDSMMGRATTVSMPVVQSHQPIIMQNGQPQNMQNSVAPNQHMQGLNLNSPSSSSTTSSNSNTAVGNLAPSRVTIKYTHPHSQPPPPYPHSGNNPSRRSPIGIQIRPNPEHASAGQHQRHTGDGRGNQRAEYDTRITISSGSEDSPGGSITFNIPTKRATPSPVPMHAWGAKHGPIIMQSVKSREVSKPVPQTATVPTSPAQQSGGGPLNTQSPSPNYVSCVQTRVNALSPSSHSPQYTQIHQQTPPSQYQPPLIQNHVNNVNRNAHSNVQIQIRHEPNNNGAINVMPGRGNVAAINKQHVDIRNPYGGATGPQPASIQFQIQKQPRHYAPVFSTPTIESYNRAAGETPSSTPRSDSPVSRTTNQSPMSVLSTTSNTASTNSDVVPDRPPPPYPGPSRTVNVEPPLSPCQPPLPPRVPLLTQINSKHPLPLPISGVCIGPSSTPPYVSSTVSSCTLEQDEQSDLEVQSLDQDSSTTTDEQAESTTTDEQIENSIGGDFEMAYSQKKHRCTSPIPERKPEAKKNDYLRHDCTVKNLSPDAFKFFMEQHVENLLKSHQQRMHRRLQLENEMAKVGLSQEAQCQMRRMLNQKESNYIRLKRAKMDKSLFKRIKTLGIGAFGEVTLVRKKDVGHLHAMKTLRKSDVLQRNQVAHVKAERDILAEADNEWVVKLYYSFQDENNLYFVMDYVPGGDLMGLLIRLGIFQEELARFYVAELVLAIESVHKMGFIHRDIKPDNVLIDRDGHIKLTDFGLCTGFRWTHNSKYYQKDLIHARQDSMDVSCGRDHIECNCAVLKPLERRRQRDHQRCLAHSLVGTPNYIAPEVLKREGYTSCCDWWSVGVILYEMLVGQPPFYAPTPAETQYKVIHWMDTLQIPSEPHLSSPAADLIIKLCRNPEDRLGANGFSEIKQHSFFKPLSFEGLRRQQAPYVPPILYPTDTSNFDAVDPERCRGSDSDSDESTKKDIYENGKHPEHAFYEFTFRRFFDDGGHPYPQVKDPESNSPVYV